MSMKPTHSCSAILFRRSYACDFFAGAPSCDLDRNRAMRLSTGSGSHFPSCAHCSAIQIERGGEQACVKPLLGASRRALFAASYRWLSSVACAEPCAVPEPPGACKKQSAQHRLLAFNDILASFEQTEQKGLQSRSDHTERSQFDRRNELNID